MDDGARIYEVRSCIRGFHVYCTIRTPVLGESLSCERQNDNLCDRYAVSTILQGTIVGHVPKNISCLCSLFLGQGGKITATVTGNRQRSYDLPQGGLEIPCLLTFRGLQQQIEKVKHLIEELKLGKTQSLVESVDATSRERAEQDRQIKVEDKVEKDSMTSVSSCEEAPMSPWIQFQKWTLTLLDRDQLTKGEKLSDNVINFVQTLLRHQFPRPMVS